MTQEENPARLLPQVGVARLVESVVELREDGIDCAGRIPPEHCLVRGGSAPALVGIEVAAQAAAVFEALRRRRSGGENAARVGFLVSLRDVRFTRPALPAGAPLVATVRAVGAAAALALYEVRVFDAGSLVLHGTLGTFLPLASRPSVEGS